MASSTYGVVPADDSFLVEVRRYASKLCDNVNGGNAPYVPDDALETVRDDDVLIREIETVLNEMIKQIALGEMPSWISLEGDIGSQEDRSNVALQPFNLARRERWKRFAVLVRMLQMSHALLLNGETQTLRKSFYDQANFFGKQACVDAAANDLARFFRVPRDRLGFVASSKGLAVGRFTFTTSDGAIFDCSHGPTLIPPKITSVGVSASTEFLLVVEKDAAFKTLFDRGFHRRFECIIITGKGFPDIGTRKLVRQLAEQHRLPAFALVDADPHGCEIMMTYRFGSKRMEHDAANLTCPTLRWLGVLPRDLVTYHVLENNRIPMMAGDVKKADELRERTEVKDWPEIQEQLTLLIEIQKKAEIQALTGGAEVDAMHFLTDQYLPHKLSEGDWL